MIKIVSKDIKEFCNEIFDRKMSCQKIEHYWNWKSSIENITQKIILNSNLKKTKDKTGLINVISLE